MTRDEFIKTSWKAYQSIDYKNERNGQVIECLLSAIDFDGETMDLCPIHEMYIQKDFTANIKFCHKHKKKMQAVK